MLISYVRLDHMLYSINYGITTLNFCTRRKNVLLFPLCVAGVPSSNPGVEADLNRGFSEEDIEDTPTLETSNRSRGEDNDSGGSPSAEGREAESSLLVSSSVGAWDILIGLMSSLKCVSWLYLEQGIVKEAHHYAREGAMLARGLLLPGW